MKAISLWQPWASLIAEGHKKIETRSWPTPYRGQIAIHAAKKWDAELRELCIDYPFQSHIPDPDALPRGCIVAIAELYDCRRMDEQLIRYVFENAGFEIDFGDYQPGRYAWMLRNVQKLPVPIPARGMQGLFEWDARMGCAGGAVGGGIMSISVFPEHELEAVYGPLRRVVGAKRESWNRWSVHLQCGHSVSRHVNTATHMQRQVAHGKDVFARCLYCMGRVPA